jgi:hypothetical protein
MRLKRYVLSSMAGVSLLLSLNCKNPFADDEIGVDTRTINGTVQLSNESDVASIYVYLSDLDLGTFTDANGRFRLTLPPSLGSSGGSVSGIFTLYFFVANYDLQSVQVAIQGGNFLFGQEALDKNGRVSPNPMLVKALTIESWATPGYRGIATAYSVRTRLMAVHRSMPVDIPNGTQEFIGGVVIQNLSTNTCYTAIQYSAGYLDVYHCDVPQQGRDFAMVFDSKALQLPPGDYRLIPHVLPRYDELAQKIAARIGIDPVLLGPTLMQWPMRYTGGFFTVVEEEPINP